ncbi:MAG: protein kinase domain-containing protein [Myxococcaceae bacterium]
MASAEDADVPPLTPGELLGERFTILRFIAQGGMGAVYEASDVKLRSGVALKVIRGRIATDMTAMERFRREVLLARRVSHPNVCRVYELYDGKTATGLPIHFLTMELLEGETLSQRLARAGRLTTAEALPLVRQLCAGLAAAHAEGVIHRDFKSSNVMLVPRGEALGESTASSTRVVITDFGIALALQVRSQETASEPLTGGGGILGTPEYMAPEQVAGDAVTQASDIYALGVVLYEMVTGKLPFTGDTPLVAAAKRLKEAPPSPEATTPGLGRRWSTTVLRCLAREPERRFKSALDIVPELERPRRRWPRWASASAILVAAALAAFVVARKSPNFRPTPPSRTAVASTPRPVVALLGFRNDLVSAESAWLPTAISEDLGRELAAAETSLRVVPGDRVAQVRRSLGVSENAVSEDSVQKRMQGLLVANVLIYGALKPAALGSASVGLSLKVLDTASGGELASFEEDLGEGGQAWADKASSLAERLRQALGVSLSQTQAAALSAVRPRNLSAVRSYAEGLIRLRRFEYETARSYFEAALATDGSFFDARRRLGETWELEGNKKKAREVAEGIRARPGGLTPRQLAETEENILSLGPEPEKGLEARTALFDATPDDVEVAVRLLSDSPPKTGAAVLGRLREHTASALVDPRIDGDEAFNAWQLGDFKRAEELIARLKARANALGARGEAADAFLAEAWMLWQGKGRGADALGPFDQAASLLEEMGELPALALAKNWRAHLMVQFLPRSAVLKALEEDAALAKKLGNHRFLREVLNSEAGLLSGSGDYKLAATKLQDSLSESEAMDEGPGPFYERDKASLALQMADMEGVRNALHLLRTDPTHHQDGIEDQAVGLEFDYLRDQDRLPEARQSMEKLLRMQQLASRLSDLPSLQARLCEIACDEGRPQEGVDCLTQHPPPAGAGSAQVLAINLRLAKCRYLAGDLPEAEKRAVEARADAQKLDSYIDRVLANVYLMRIRAALGGTVKSIAELRVELTDAERRGAKAMAFEVALALGEVELRAHPARGRARLVELESDAKSREFLRIARFARESLDGKHPAASKPVQ